jgi:hypothetical protein
MRRREHRTGRGLPAAHLPPHPAHEVIGSRLHLGLVERTRRIDETRGLPPGDRVHEADRPAVLRLSGQLRRAEDRGGARHVHVHCIADSRPLRGAPDPAAVEELGTAPAEAEHLAALHEEGPAFGEPRFEHGEVHLRGIRFHLPEVGVDGRVQREVAGGAVGEVDTDPAAEVATIPERIPRLGLVEGRTSHEIGKRLPSATRPDSAQPREMPERRDPTALSARRERENGALLTSPDLTLDLHAPGLDLAGTEPDLVKRDAHLHRPSRIRNGGRDLPDRVPRRIPAGVLATGEHLVLTHAGRVHAQPEGGGPVQVTVQCDSEPVGVGKSGIAAGETRRDRFVVVEPRGHVEGLVVVQDPDLGTLADGPSLVGHDLPESGHRLGGLPGGLARISVDHGRLRRAHGRDRRSRRLLTGHGRTRHQCGERDRQGRGDPDTER